MSKTQKSDWLDGGVALDREVFNQRMSAYVRGDNLVEICLTEWSGRRENPEAIAGIDELIAFLTDVRREIVESSTPKIHLSISEDRCKHCHRHFADCNCDYCELEGHIWSPTYALDGEIFKSCINCGLETSEGKQSWRSEIVNEEIAKDEAR